MSKKKIILHGYLADLYPKDIEVEAETIAEAVRSLEQIEELKPKDGSPHPVVIDGVDTEIALYAQTQVDEIHVRPRTGGAGGKNGLMQVLIGVALIAIGIWNPAFLGAVGLSGGSLILTGGLMVAGGLLQMLAPKPDESEERTSNYLGASGNTVSIGTPIPMGYGTRKIGGHYLSFDVDAVEISAGAPAPSNGAADLPEDENFPDPSDETHLQAVEDNSGSVVTSTIDDSFYFEIDRTPVPLAVVCPVYDSATASPTNEPTSAWIT